MPKKICVIGANQVLLKSSATKLLEWLTSEADKRKKFSCLNVWLVASSGLTRI